MIQNSSKTTLRMKTTVNNVLLMNATQFKQHHRNARHCRTAAFRDRQTIQAQLLKWKKQIETSDF